MDNLPKVVINGTNLSDKEVLSLDVAVQHFMGHLTTQKYPLGADKLGASLKEAYLHHLGNINKILQTGK